MSRSHALAFVVLGLAASLAVPPPARGDDAPASDLAAKVADLEARVAKDAVAKDDAALARDAEALLRTAGEVSETALKARLVDVAAKILATTSNEIALRAAIQTLGKLGDPAGFAPLRRFLASPTPAEVEAVGKLLADESVPVLLAIVSRASDPALAGAAIDALGGFGSHKTVRERILWEVVVSVGKDRPAVGYRLGSVPRATVPRSPASQARYDALAPRMTAALNRLTGQNVVAAEDWFDLAEKFKKYPEVLFNSAPEAVEESTEKASPELEAKVAEFEGMAAKPVALRLPALVHTNITIAVGFAGLTSDPAIRTRLADVVGSILFATSDEAVEREAVQALGKIGDSASYRFLWPRFVVWETNGLRFDAIAAAAATRSPDAVSVLLALLQRAELPVAVAALKALKSFGREKAVREKAVLEIVDTVKDVRVAPAGVPRPPPCIPWPEGEASARYDALAPEMVATLNAMTGCNLAGPDDWFSLVADHREKPSALFLDK